MKINMNNIFFQLYKLENKGIQEFSLMPLIKRAQGDTTLYQSIWCGHDRITESERCLPKHEANALLKKVLSSDWKVTGYGISTKVMYITITKGDIHVRLWNNEKGIDIVINTFSSI